MIRYGSSAAVADLQEMDTFTVLTYNLMTQIPSPTLEKLGWAASWHYRQKRLVDEITGYRADILCLQEIHQNDFRTWFEPELQKFGYAGIFKKSKSIQMDGCATFYLNNRFLNLNTYEIEFDTLADEVAKKFGTPQETEKVKIHLSTVNTHICPMSRQRVSLFQVEKFAADPKVPSILCGHFNANPVSDAYKFVTKGKLDLEAGDLKFTHVQVKGYSDIEKAVFKHLKPKRGTSLVSAYAHLFGSLPIGNPYRQKKHETFNEPCFTFLKCHMADVLDYIFYTDMKKFNK
ncbi:carbon catabolite repressor protein 4 homolog 1-like [Rosa rugosa]|uniref:carbon catabolite repressor protein 4 homolog 1-like n=1 Tax=Rosa rugosa TaxID=74645 RepID=UPI002B40A44E|nr:carbon catabolite repressor protein 4 homolog 1-like [Rosa rugosa]